MKNLKSPFVLLALSLSSFFSFAQTLHAQETKLYWADTAAGTIQRANLDGSQAEILLQSFADSPAGLELDTAHGQLLWLDETRSKIRRANMDGSLIEESYSVLTRPQRIAFDSVTNRVFVSTHQDGTHIQVFNADGSNYATFPTSPVTGIAIHSKTGKLYWTENIVDPHFPIQRIRRANFDGSNLETLLTNSSFPSPAMNKIRGISLDLSAGKMYWGSSSSIARSNLDGSSPQLLISNLSLVWDMALDLGAGKIYWTEKSSNKICRANLNGSSVETLVQTDLLEPQGLRLDSIAGKMFWANKGKHQIQRANLDGTQIETLVSAKLGQPIDIAVDPVAGKLYWTDSSLTSVRQANLDGSGVELLSNASDSVSGLTLDASRNQLFWAENTNSLIRRLILDGSPAEIFLDGGSIKGNPIGLSVDTQNRKLFFSGSDLRTIGLDGNGLSAFTSFPFCAGIVIHSAETKLYSIGFFSGLVSKILKSSLDGSAIEELVTLNAQRKSLRLAVDPNSQKLYWSENAIQPNPQLHSEGTIMKSNLDGSNIEAVMTGLDSPGGLAIVNCTIQPFGDLDQSGIVNLADILHSLNGFSHPEFYPETDLFPCGGDGFVNLDDILAMLSAFSGMANCPDTCN